MSVRLILAGAALLALAGCNMFPAAPPSNVDKSGSRSTSSENTSGERSASDDRRDDSRENEDRGDSSRDSDRADTSSDDPSLVRSLSQQVLAVRQTLPQRQGPFTIYDVESEGTRLIYHMRTGENITNGTFAQFETGLERELCRNRDTEELIRLGGVFTYNVEDGDGDTFSTNIDRC